MRNKLDVTNMEAVQASQKTEYTLNIVNVSATQTKIEIPRTTERVAPSYQELPGLRVETKDVLKLLQHNIQLLEDLGGRLGFVMSEVRSVIRR
jgi:hypothetical protein